MKEIEDDLKLQNLLSIATFDLFKYANAGGRVEVVDTPDGLTITLPGVTLSSEGINKRFGKMIAAAQEAS